MFDSSTWSNRLGWQTIENNLEPRATSGPSIFVTKPVKKIRRRTRILNGELKKFGRLTSYSQYVRIKTKILRNVSDDDEYNDDEPYSVGSSDNEDTGSEERFALRDTSEFNPLMADDSEENNEIVAGNREDDEDSCSSGDNTRAKVCARAKRNLTSLLNNLDTTCPTVDRTRIDEIVNNDDDDDDDDDDNNNNRQTSGETTSNKPILQITNAPAGDSGIDDDSQDNSSSNNRENDDATRLDDIAETSDRQKDLPLDEVTSTYEISMSEEKNKNKKNNENVEPKKEEEEEEQQQQQQPITSDELMKKKCQPTITCTEIVRTKYTIIRDENEKENSSEEFSRDNDILRKDEESMKFDTISPESKRVAQLKRINLLCSGSDSDTSIDDEIIDDTSDRPIYDTSKPSQLISDPSDSEDDDVVSKTSSLLHITDTDDPPTGRINDHHEQDRISSRNTEFVDFTKKSIKNQIEEQEIVNSSLIDDREAGNNEIEVYEQDIVDGELFSSAIDEKKNVNCLRKKKKGPSDAESLQYVLNKLSNRSINDEDLVSSNDNIRDRDPLEIDEENLPRPIELCDFVARQNLVKTSESSTITIKDVETSYGTQDDDDEIWLMEIPRSIITDPELCGKSIVMDKKKMIIGDTSYETTLRHDKSVSCILRTGRKKARYKAVNIRPVCSILVRHESSKKLEGSIDFGETPQSPKTVPFPKNVKSRNPLTTENERATASSSSKSTNQRADGDRRKRRKNKKRPNCLWHIDHFILKSKKRRIDLS